MKAGKRQKGKDSKTYRKTPKDRKRAQREREKPTYDTCTKVSKEIYTRMC